MILGPGRVGTGGTSSSSSRMYWWRSGIDSRWRYLIVTQHICIEQLMEFWTHLVTPRDTSSARCVAPGDLVRMMINRTAGSWSDCKLQAERLREQSLNTLSTTSCDHRQTHLHQANCPRDMRINIGIHSNQYLIRVFLLVSSVQPPKTDRRESSHLRLVVIHTDLFGRYFRHSFIKLERHWRGRRGSHR